MSGAVWPLVDSAAMRALDRHTIETLGVPGQLLMENAGRAVAALSVVETDQMMLITEKGMIVRTLCKQVSRYGRNTAGVRVINLKEGDKLIAAARVGED